MFEEARNNISNTTRRGLALYFGTVNLAGETLTNPTKILKGIERRGEKVLDRIDDNNRQVRRSVTLLRKRTSETASSVRGTARATVGLASTMADDVTATAPSTRKRAAGRKRSTSARTRVAAAGRSTTGTRGSSTGSASTRSNSTTSSGSRSKAAVAKQRSQAAQKAARTRALNEKKAELKKARTVAKARATRAKNESKTALDKASDSVQHGFQVVGQRLENVGERIEHSVEKVAS
ncbi:MAG: hypothetical protein NVSMB17_11230 [Candidatus Dormibacteria bacterium]